MNKRNFTVIISLLVIALFALSGTASAQQAIPEAPVLRIAFVDGQKLADPAKGTKRMIAAWKQLETEFGPRQTELKGMQEKIDALTKTYNATRGTASPADLGKLTEQVEQLQRDYKFKQDSAQSDLQRRQRTVIEPIYQEVSKHLETFAKAKKVDVVLDISKMAGNGLLLVLDPKGDMTDAFIAYVDARP